MVSTPNADDLLKHATQLRRAGHAPEAAEVYERLLRLKPELPDSWYNLAVLQQRLRRFDAALHSYQRALDHKIGQPEEVHLNRAVIYAGHLARPDDAERELHTALGLNPRYSPALLNLGNLCEHRGERAAAVEAYERALAADPTNTLALARLPTVKRLSGIDDPLLDRVRQAIGRPGTSPAERADLGFGLGKALDDLGAFDQAFAAYTEANHNSRLSAGANGAHYDAFAHEQLIDRIIQAFPGPAAPASTPPVDSTRRIFICGMFRSGSTLVEQMLASHPRVTSGGELTLLPRLVRELLGSFNKPVPPLDGALLQRLRSSYREGVARLFPDAEVITDKRPDNFLYIGLIKAMFPNAKIVHTHRDPMDNCLSVFFLHLTHAMPYALDLRDIAHWYSQYRRLMAHWSSIYGDDIHDVDYDALVAAPRPAVHRLLGYCGLPWDDACLAFHETRNVVMTASVWQVRQPLYTRSSGRWRHYSHHLDGLREALALTN